jgi:ferritin
MTQEIINNLNTQISKEFEASIFYLRLASYYDSRGYEGLANFYYDQSEEERNHMLMVIKYSNEKGYKVNLNIESNNDEIENNLDMLSSFEMSLNHEEMVTKFIHKSFLKAQELGDLETTDFLSFFIKEQREEEGKFRSLIDELNIGGNSKQVQFIINERLKTNKADIENV